MHCSKKIMKNAFTFSYLIRALKNSIRILYGQEKIMCFIVQLRKTAFVARFSRASYYQIADFIEYGDCEDEYFISLNGKHFSITIVS